MRSVDLTRLGRVHGGDVLRLSLRNLYLLPTRFGLLWLGGAVLLQVVGIQTQRNGPLLLSFLLLALMLLALHLTHWNLQGLELGVGEPRPGFADGPLLYPLQLRSDCRREAIEIRQQRGDGLLGQRVEPGTSSLALPWQCSRRGLQRPGTLLIRSTAPLGLFLCWSRWQPSRPQAVIPARLTGPVGNLSTEQPQRTATQEVIASREGSEHWQDLRPHRPEDSQARLAWKALAQGRGRLSKVFRDAEDTPPLLAPAPGVPHERALEHLSARVWQLSERGECFGLQLPDRTISPGQGRDHRDQCLLALALSP